MALIPGRTRTEALLAGQSAVLELVAAGAPLAEVLTAIVTFIEPLSHGLLGSILLLEGNRLRSGAAPSLPDAYNQAIDNAPIGPHAGSCGTAAFRREAVMVRDIATDPLWADYRDLALPHGLRSCWSRPIFSNHGEVLGTFAFYQDHPGTPSAWDFTLIDSATHLAGIAIARQRADDERTRLVHDLEEAVRLRDHFLSIASHELKTPLTSLQFVIQSLQKLGRADASPPVPESFAREAMSLADRQIKRLTRLINMLLTMSRLQADRLDLMVEPVDLAGLVRDGVALFRVELAQTRTTLQLQADRPAVGCWDRDRLDQVVVNLLANAIKYGAGRPIDVRVEVADPVARLVVTDRGIGIAPEDQVRIFERFGRAVSDRHYGGFGLGLYISRRIVEGLGGTIRVQSALGEGATFTVALPLASTGAGPCP